MYRFLLLEAMAFVYLANIYCQEHNRAVIMSGPEHQIVAPYDKVSFNCIAQGQLVFWQIDKRCPCSESETAKLEERGFHFSQDGENNKTIAVEATLANNGTIISCIALEESGGKIVSHAFQEGSLIIAGPPLAPSVHLTVWHLGSDTFIFTLNWSTMFTWSGFPIISYNITMTNYSNEQPTTTVNITESNINHIEYTGRGSGCHTLTFSIEANNSIGRGDRALIYSAQPIAIDGVGEIEISFRLLPNGEQHFWISFHVPIICAGYQMGIYNITIYDTDGAVVNHFGPIKYTQQNNSERLLVVKGLKSGLIFGSQYEAEVTVESLGMLRSRRKNFIHNYTGTAASHLPCLVNQRSSQVIIIGTSIGAVFLVFIFILMVVILMVVCRHEKKRSELDEPDNGALPRRRRARVPPHKMEANPIYEGVIYETTPGESFKPLLINPSKVETDHGPHFKACPSRSSPIAEGDVRYSGIQVSNEMKATATIGSDGALTYYRNNDDIKKNPGDLHIMHISKRKCTQH